MQRHSQARTLDGLRVLLVADDVDGRKILALCLEAYGAEVRGVESVAQGLRMLLRWRPMVVVSDLSLPREDGFELIRRLRRLRSSEGGLTGAIALTGHADSPIGRRAVPAGFDLVLPKPTSLRQLLPALLAVAALSLRALLVSTVI